MPPPVVQHQIDAAWPTIEKVVETALGSHDKQAISKVCPESMLSELTWKADGRRGWQPWRSFPSVPRAGAVTRRRRTLATGERRYVELRHQLELTADQLIALSVALDTDDVCNRLKDFAAGARDQFSHLTARYLAYCAGTRMHEPGSSIDEVLDKIQPDVSGRGRYRLAIVDEDPVDDPPGYITSQTRLSFRYGSPAWRALVLSTDRAGIRVERAFPLTLGWQPSKSGATLILDERFSYRQPESFSRDDVILIR